jgi:uncharacterized protein with HEPN domain
MEYQDYLKDIQYSMVLSQQFTADSEIVWVTIKSTIPQLLPMISRLVDK